MYQGRLPSTTANHLILLLQGMLGLCRKEPAWTSSLGAVLHSICFDVAESADVATCVALLQQLLHHVQQAQPLPCVSLQNAHSAGRLSL